MADVDQPASRAAGRPPGGHWGRAVLKGLILAGAAATAVVLTSFLLQWETVDRAKPAMSGGGVVVLVLVVDALAIVAALFLLFGWRWIRRDLGPRDDG